MGATTIDEVRRTLLHIVDDVNNNVYYRALKTCKALMKYEDEVLKFEPMASGGRYVMSGVDVYKRTLNQTGSSRDTEFRLLAQVTTALINAQKIEGDVKSDPVKMAQLCRCVELEQAGLGSVRRGLWRGRKPASPGNFGPPLSASAFGDQGNRQGP